MPATLAFKHLNPDQKRCKLFPNDSKLYYHTYQKEDSFPKEMPQVAKANDYALQQIRFQAQVTSVWDREPNTKPKWGFVA